MQTVPDENFVVGVWGSRLRDLRVESSARREPSEIKILPRLVTHMGLSEN